MVMLLKEAANRIDVTDSYASIVVTSLGTIYVHIQVACNNSDLYKFVTGVISSECGRSLDDDND